MKWLLIVIKITIKLNFGCQITTKYDFSDQLSQDNWYLTLATKVLVTYTIRF